jgi:multiple sugar transport system permease protein
MFEPRWKTTLKALLYLSPALIVIAVFVIYPMFRSVWISFFKDYNIFKHTGSGFGLDNYKWVLNDGRFILALKNTTIYTIVVVPVSMALALLTAVLLNSKMRGMKFFETLYFLPYITNLIAIGLAFRFIFNSTYGILNRILGIFGVDTIMWLNDPKYSLPALIIFGIWSGLAFKIVVFLAGIQGINKQYYQAAKIDNTSRWRTFTKITMPMLSPMIFYIGIISFIGALKTYVEVVGLYGNNPGPADTAMTIVYYVYDLFYGANEPPRAAAASVILFLIILVFTFIQLRVSKKRVQY